jgi:hypothetical protein
MIPSSGCYLAVSVAAPSRLTGYSAKDPTRRRARRGHRPRRDRPSRPTATRPAPASAPAASLSGGATGKPLARRRPCSVCAFCRRPKLAALLSRQIGSLIMTPRVRVGPVGWPDSDSRRHPGESATRRPGPGNTVTATVTLSNVHHSHGNLQASAAGCSLGAAERFQLIITSEDFFPIMARHRSLRLIFDDSVYDPQ